MKIIENEEKGNVQIDGKIILGFIDEEKCKKCGNPRIYYDDYDSFFCAYCNVWLESKCGDPFCSYCKNKPKKPI